jgi:hypothetical protein
MYVETFGTRNCWIVIELIKTQKYDSYWNVCVIPTTGYPDLEN